MAKTDRSGPAFPTNVDSSVLDTVAYPGMSLRDYFAAKAISAFLHLSDGPLDDVEAAAFRAYQIADSMLRQRKK